MKMLAETDTFNKSDQLLGFPDHSSNHASATSTTMRLKLSSPPAKKSKLSRCKASDSSLSINEKLWDECVDKPVIDDTACPETNNTISVQNKQSQKSEISVKKYVCSFCGAKLSARRNLNRHIKSKHRNKTKGKTVCGVCGKNISFGYLSQHLKTKHNIDKESMVSNRQSQQQLAADPSDDNKDIKPGVASDQTIADNLLKLLPTSDYEYSVISYHDISSLSNSFTASFTINIDTPAQFAEWRNKFQSNTCTQYTITHTPKCVEGLSVVFKQYFKCLHKKRNCEKGIGNNTGCPTRLTVTIIKSTTKRKNPNKFPCHVDLSWCHNHPIKASDVVRRHRVASATDEKLIKLFNSGHSVNTARDCLRAEIEANSAENDANLPYDASIDRSICPDYKHCNYIYNKIFKNKYGSTVDREQLVEFIAEYNDKHEEGTVMQEEYHGKSLIAICTPLMKRIHLKLREAGELMFVDCSAGFDSSGSKIVLFMTHSESGGIPLAVGVTPSESINALTRLLNLIKQVLPENAFYSRGRDHGPQLVMTNDLAALQSALHNVWPQARQLLCQLNVLRSTWQFLLNAQNNVDVVYRPSLFSLVKKMVYAETEGDLVTRYELFLVSNVLTMYSNFKEHIRELYERKRLKWCSAFRAGLPVRDKHTLNYVETEFKVLKDEIFAKTRAYNIVHLMHFLTDKLTSYYERRLLDYSSNRLPYQPLPFLECTGQQRIRNNLSEDVFEIESSTDGDVSYTVNTAARMCTCSEGAAGEQCTHLQYVLAQIELGGDSYDYQFDDSNREVMYFVARGCVSPPVEHCLDTLYDSSSVTDHTTVTFSTAPLAYTSATPVSCDYFGNSSSVATIATARLAHMTVPTSSLNCSVNSPSVSIAPLVYMAAPTTSQNCPVNASSVAAAPLLAYMAAPTTSRNCLVNAPSVAAAPLVAYMTAPTTSRNCPVNASSVAAAPLFAYMSNPSMSRNFPVNAPCVAAAPLLAYMAAPTMSRDSFVDISSVVTGYDISQQLPAAREQCLHSISSIATDNGFAQQLTVTSDNSIARPLTVATDNDIAQQLTAAREEYNRVFQAMADKHCKISPTEMLAAFETATVTLKTISTTREAICALHSIGKF